MLSKDPEVLGTLNDLEETRKRISHKIKSKHTRLCNTNDKKGEKNDEMMRLEKLSCELVAQIFLIY